MTSTTTTIPLQSIQPMKPNIQEPQSNSPPPSPPSSPQTPPDDIPPLKPRSPLRLSLILLALYLSLFLAALDATIVSTAIPTISSHFRAPSAYLWIGGAYLLAECATGPIWGRLSDIWGRKPILLAAIAVFAVGSVLCGAAGGMGMLLVGRAVQGAAAGGLLLLVNVVVSDLFDLRRRSLFLGSMEFVWAVASSIGPVLGGVFAELVSWRWIWYINLPISGFTFLITLFFLNVHNPKTKIMDGLKAIDWIGSIALLGVTLMTLLGLDFGGQTFPWSSPKVLCLIIFGLLLLGVFFFSEAKVARYPLVPLGLFRNKSNVASFTVCFVHGMALIAGEYYLPLLFQSVREASPLKSGVFILPFVVSTSIVGIVVGFVIHRTGRYLECLWAGVTLLTLGFGLFIDIDAKSSLAKVIAYQIVAGIGSGFCFEPPLIALQATSAQDEVAAATATLNFIRSLATALGIVVCGVVFQDSMSLRAPVLRNSGLPSNITSQLAGATAAANVGLIATIQDAAQELVVKEAFAWSIRNMWILIAGLSAFGVVAALFVESHVLGRDHTETKTGLKDEEREELRSV